jgi:hypothetical protein
VEEAPASGEETAAVMAAVKVAAAMLVCDGEETMREGDSAISATAGVATDERIRIAAAKVEGVAAVQTGAEGVAAGETGAADALAAGEATGERTIGVDTIATAGGIE